MEENKEMQAKPEKLSYEQLEEIAHQLSDQVKQLYTKLQESNVANMFKRLDYLFKVVEYQFHFDDEFVEKCKKEIVDMMTIPEKEEVEEESKSE